MKILTLLQEQLLSQIEDMSGNLILMDPNGILIQSAKDLVLTADGDVEIQGTNIHNGANAKFSAEGGSGAAVESGGQTVIKGSLVAIN